MTIQDALNFMQENVLAFVGGRSGHFRFESGHHGDLWLPLETLCLNPRKVQGLAAQLAARLLPHRVEVVCGPLVEGAFIALLVSLESGSDFVYAERFRNEGRGGLYPVDYRLPGALEPRVKGKRVAIVNDVISAGSAVRGAFFSLQSAGAEIVAIGALLALGETIRAFQAEHHVALEILQQAPHNLWTPPECPLCAAGVPLEIMGTT